MIKVGVVRGGISPEYEVSIKTGANVIYHLRSDKMKDNYIPVDIFIDKDGTWHIDGLPTTYEKIKNKVDVIFNALHGDFGEDGQIQKILEDLEIPYTGSTSLPSAVGYNKALAKDEFIKLGIKTPKSILYPAYLEDLDGPKDEYPIKKAKEVVNKLPPPWIVKPLASGSSMGMHMCKTGEDLVKAFTDSMNQKVSVLVEEMIIGKEATVAVIDNFRDRNIYSLPPIEIRIPKDKNFFDYDAKYSGKSEEICPGNFREEEKRELEKLASLIHNGLGLSHYSRSDFIIHPTKGIYALEVNTLPGLTDESLTPKALYAVGATMPEFLDHIIKLAINKK